MKQQEKGVLRKQDAFFAPSCILPADGLSDEQRAQGLFVEGTERIEVALPHQRLCGGHQHQQTDVQRQGKEKVKLYLKEHEGLIDEISNKVIEAHKEAMEKQRQANKYAEKTVEKEDEAKPEEASYDGGDE